MSNALSVSLSLIAYMLVSPMHDKIKIILDDSHLAAHLLSLARRRSDVHLLPIRADKVPYARAVVMEISMAATTLCIRAATMVSKVTLLLLLLSCIIAAVKELGRFLNDNGRARTCGVAIALV